MVDGFFGLSGFLVSRSALQSQNIVNYAANRVFRIFPGLAVCLIFSSFVIAPIIATCEGVALGFSDQVHYVAFNILTWPSQFELGNLLTNAPFPRSLNGSLWTLKWEVLAYICLWIFVRHLPRRTLFTVVPAILFACVDISVNYLNTFSFLSAGAHELLASGARLGFMFTVGVLLQHFAERIQVSKLNAVVSLALFVSSILTNFYRPIGGLALVYLLLFVGVNASTPKWLRKNDLSYGVYIYAFPIQQLIVAMGLGFGSVWAVAAIAVGVTLVVAALSWFLIERPALRIVRPRFLRLLAIPGPKTKEDS